MTPVVLTGDFGELRLTWDDDIDMLVADDPDVLTASGVQVVAVAGASHFTHELEEGCFSPGDPVSFGAEPDNPFDPNAVAVWDAAGGLQAGYVPTRFALELLDDVEAGAPVGGVVVAERHDRGGRRIGIAIAYGVGVTVRP